LPASLAAERRRPLAPHPWCRLAFGTFLLAAGTMHFVAPEVYEGIMPRWLPAHRALVYVSGVAEILGGFGLFPHSTRRVASIGVIALLIAVFPANIQMLLNWLDRGVSWWVETLLWLRLPLQVVLIWWAWLLGRPAPLRSENQE
jgi:uncharacterized membrane protein